MNNYPEFLISDTVDIKYLGKSLGPGIIKKFTSQASIATLYRWNFGDDVTLETHENPIIHEYERPGTYIVSHQTCYTCRDVLTCSEEWCIKSIDVTTPREPLWISSWAPPMMAFGFIGLMIATSKRKKMLRTKLL